MMLTRLISQLPFVLIAFSASAQDASVISTILGAVPVLDLRPDRASVIVQQFGAGNQ